MLKLVNVVCVLALIGTLSATIAFAAPKKVAKGPVAGEDEYRSAIGYTVATMEHCKALNKLTKTKGTFNAELAKEHAGEAARNASAATRHVGSFVSTSGSGPVAVSATDAPTISASEANVSRCASVLEQQAGSSADRAALAASSTDLYLAAKDLLAAQRLTGKAMGISAASPPKKPGEKKPGAKKPPKAKKTKVGEASASAK